MNLFYREYGAGFPVVILHGLYGSSDNWVSIANELAESYRIILPDLRNHGKSPHNIIHTYDSMSKDIHELVQKLEINKFVLVGHSMGGKTASFFARQWPDMLAGLVIIDISPFRTEPENTSSDTMHGHILKKTCEIDPSLLKSREEADKIFSEIISSVKVRNFLLKNLQRNNEGVYEWKHNPQNLYDNLENIFDGFKRPGHGDIDPVRGFPVYFLKAMDSDYIGEQDYDPIQEIFPAAEIIEVPDSSHWIHAEKPQLLIKLLRDNFPV